MREIERWRERKRETERNGDDNTNLGYNKYGYYNLYFGVIESVPAQNRRMTILYL